MSNANRCVIFNGEQIGKAAWPVIAGLPPLTIVTNGVGQAVVESASIAGLLESSTKQIGTDRNYL
jgi:hypothetical protein